MSRTVQTIAGKTARTIDGVAKRWNVSRTTARRRLKVGLLPPPDFIDDNGFRWWLDESVDRQDRKRLRGARQRAQASHAAT
jgi:hypothetical protein